jgi:hypothetical protein
MRIALFSLSFLSVSALACPPVAGTYLNCRSNTGATSGVTDLVVTQRGNTYTVTGTEVSTQHRLTETFTTDRQPVNGSQVIPGLGLRVNTVITSWCEGQVLRANVQARSFGQTAGQAMVDVRRQGHNLYVNATGSFMGRPMTETLICE